MKGKKSSICQLFSIYFSLHLLIGCTGDDEITDDQFEKKPVVELTQEEIKYQEESNSGLVRSTTPPLTSNWMRNIPDETLLSTLAIPGTHDSESDNLLGANSIGTTQNWPLAKQLRFGIRFIDIRIRNGQLSSDQNPNDFVVAHGPINVGSFNNVISDTMKFLSENPSEVILMSIKHERHGTDLVDSYIRGENDELDKHRLINDYIYSANSVFSKTNVNVNTTLRELRGKIVFVDRIGLNLDLGLNWGTDLNVPGIEKMNIQDEYNLKTIFNVSQGCVNDGLDTILSHCLDYDNKKEAVKLALDNAYTANDKKFRVNFLSANYNGLWVKKNAETVNPDVSTYFQNRLFRVPSIIIMDFPTQELVYSIILNSFKTYPTPTIIPKGQFNTIASDGFWGDWGSISMCPKNQFVFGYRLRSERNQGKGDDTALNSIDLYCGTYKGNANNKIYSHGGYTRWGTFSSKIKYCEGENNPVAGFSIRIEPKQGKGDDTAANDIDLKCLDKKTISAHVNTTWGDWHGDYYCPTGQAVVGLTSRAENFSGSHDDILNFANDLQETSNKVSSFVNTVFNATGISSILGIPDIPIFSIFSSSSDIDDTGLNGVRLFCKPYKK